MLMETVTAIAMRVDGTNYAEVSEHINYSTTNMDPCKIDGGQVKQTPVSGNPQSASFTHDMWSKRLKSTVPAPSLKLLQCLSFQTCFGNA